ncbi:hypothetical protein B0T26DRAFT_99613 [Lasiosphaeria miniovina]|uniref:Uncharacterized protein n=1 Tax=Lasiosphaeria miniovina TaxID=1954250 RepID=A0AA40BJE7_9PEZI|nr:uncharacterized protein B0T26DRAFT_99613 [Lasiosphaeria miniovina]KAK0735257.1 hypothetical protein B0T26DRAFT_99613 [Lasiosphaeria miniovina]
MSMECFDLPRFEMRKLNLEPCQQQLSVHALTGDRTEETARVPAVVEESLTASSQRPAVANEPNLAVHAHPRCSSLHTMGTPSLVSGDTIRPGQKYERQISFASFEWKRQHATCSRPIPRKAIERQPPYPSSQDRSISCVWGARARPHMHIMEPAGLKFVACIYRFLSILGVAAVIAGTSFSHGRIGVLVGFPFRNSSPQSICHYCCQCPGDSLDGLVEACRDLGLRTSRHTPALRPYRPLERSRPSTSKVKAPPCLFMDCRAVFSRLMLYLSPVWLLWRYKPERSHSSCLSFATCALTTDFTVTHRDSHSSRVGHPHTERPCCNGTAS